MPLGAAFVRLLALNVDVEVTSRLVAMKEYKPA
jgi:hypothetical protein